MAIIIEHFRHASRDKPGIHLNQKGVETARKQGKKFGPYGLVVSSPLTRAVETAVAMGYAVDRTEKFISDIPDAVHQTVSYDAGFEAIGAHLDSERSVIQDYLREMRQFYEELMRDFPKKGRILLVSHGGVIEWSALAVHPEAKTWGKPMKKGEGFRLVF
ncbi:MAG: histidine phosphatase family protein [Proteobacteria bacterium]|nr:MAG: histidine phosphatase family protein [Pseudomonadota bacterium]